ncbi:MAG: deoxyribodipyrimidine photolyase, partial [Candidatus Krumholzibacteria bacterium]|nr:deoxyribodipyrimidine photolyase [Candidatus Krumholzibacteria bacterium]
YVERSADAGKGLLQALSKKAAVVVTDEFPCFMLPSMVSAAAQQVAVRMETVDGNGLLPLRAAEGRVYPTAFAFRRFVHKTLPDHIAAIPKKSPLRGVDLPRLRGLPAEIRQQWPRASKALLAGKGDGLASIPIDHSVPPVSYRGGSRAASTLLKRFVTRNLDRYADDRNDIDETPTSGLSPYLHFGHVSSHEIFTRTAAREEWNPGKTFAKAISRRRGWWGMSESAEAFLDQLVTWRELGYNMTFHRKDYDRYGSLPPWARETLDEHAKDRRPHGYSLHQFEEAKTHDELWNAAQRELVDEGKIHNYLRMLWGKKILEWSRSPRKALDIMIELNNKYGVDGRNPNSYSGIFWTLGRYDRPWGPERPIFGKIRYMSSENTARKIRVDNYINRRYP